MFLPQIREILIRRKVLICLIKLYIKSQYNANEYQDYLFY